MATILIVDDSETLRLQVKQDLQESGHSVIEASDGAQGLEVSEGNPNIDLVLCDVNMPHIDGLTMCQKLTERSLLTGVPIVMLTTESSPDLKAKGKELGVIAWMVKPYNPDSLRKAVDKILNRKQQ